MSRSSQLGQVHGQSRVLSVVWGSVGVGFDVRCKDPSQPGSNSFGPRCLNRCPHAFLWIYVGSRSQIRAHGFRSRPGRGSDRASQDSRLRSQKGGVEFINFSFGPFGSEICSEQLFVSNSCQNPGSDPLEPTPIARSTQNSRIAKSHF